MEKLCLGEAQALVAFRALEKKMSPSVIASLHLGASNLFEEAALLLRENTGKFNALSDRLKRCIALNSSLQQIRSYPQLAAIQHGNEEAGLAVALCEVCVALHVYFEVLVGQKALKLLETCLVVAETDDRWLELVHQEQNFLESLE